MKQAVYCKNTIFFIALSSLFILLFQEINVHAEGAKVNINENQEKEKSKKKNLNEIVSNFADSYPEAVKYLKSERNIDISDKQVVEKMSFKDVEKAVNDFKTFKLNSQRKLNADIEVIDKKEQKNTSDVVDTSKNGIVTTIIQNTTSDNVAKEKTTNVEITFDKQNLLKGNIYGLSCPKNSVQDLIIDGKLWNFKTTERILNNSYLNGNSSEDKENLSCTRFSNEMTGTFKVKCNSGTLQIDGNCKPTGCQKDKEFNLAWDIFSYKLKLDKNYSEQSVVRDSLSDYSTYDFGDNLSCKRFDPLLEGKIKLKCVSGVVKIQETSCVVPEIANKDCSIDATNKKVVCVNNVADVLLKKGGIKQVIDKLKEAIKKKEEPTSCPGNYSNEYGTYLIPFASANEQGPYLIHRTVILKNNVECNGNNDFNDNETIVCTIQGWKRQNCETKPGQVQCPGSYIGRKLADYGFNGPYNIGREIFLPTFSGWDCDLEAISCNGSGVWEIVSCINP